MKYQILLYGAGENCSGMLEILRESRIEIIAILDSDPNKWEKEIKGYRIEPPYIIKKYLNLNLYITVIDTSAKTTIRNELQQIYGYNLKNEISFHKLFLLAHREHLKIRQYIFEHPVSKNKNESILFDCHNGLVLGGIESWTMDVCKEFIINGIHDVFIISNKGTYHVPPIIENHIIYVDINHEKIFSIPSVLNIINVILKKLPCKVITCMVDDVMLAAYLVKCFYPDMIKIISVIHGSTPSIYDDYISFRECSDFYVGVSQDIKNDMIGLGIESNSIESMTCPFYCEKSLNRTYTVNKKMPICIGYAGRMDGMENSQKRMDLLLKLMKLLEQKKVDFKAEFAGDGSARNKMECYVSLNNLNERICFLGKLEHSEIPDFWKRQDICINLADYEGRSISVIEAMGSGTIPVVTAKSGVREDIIDNVNGYIVPLGDYQLMAERIEYLSEHRERLEEMGKAAHNSIYPKSLMESHLRLWKKILFEFMN